MDADLGDSGTEGNGGDRKSNFSHSTYLPPQTETEAVVTVIRMQSYVMITQLFEPDNFNEWQKPKPMLNQQPREWWRPLPNQPK